jgi:hypothetical protein
MPTSTSTPTHVSILSRHRRTIGVVTISVAIVGALVASGVVTLPVVMALALFGAMTASDPSIAP